MLIRYNKNHEKIAMGLLSFNPDEKDLQKLLQTINEYVTEQNQQLYLWKEEEGIIGVIGVKVDVLEVQLQHLSVNPSHRDKGLGKRMIKELLVLYPEKKLTATETTEAFVEKFDAEQSLEYENKKEHPLTVF
jgi:riboflavin biosynthesis RibT protein